MTDPTKARLLEAAGEEFAAKGFEGATVRSICARAGVNLAAVNYHFGDKEQLYEQAVVEAHRCSSEVPPPGEEHHSPEEQLRQYIRSFLGRVLAMQGESTWHNRLMMRELTQPTHAIERLVREAIRPHFEELERILARICPDVDPLKLHALAFSVIGQCLHYRLADPVSRRLIGRSAYEALDLDYLTEHISAFSLAALGLAAPVCGDPSQDQRRMVGGGRG